MCDNNDNASSDGGWRTTHRTDRHASTSSKRSFEGQAAAESSVCARLPAPERSGSSSSNSRRSVTSRRPTARYRRSAFAPDVGGASASGDLTLGASFETPIELLSPEAGMRASAADVINLEADDAASHPAPTLNFEAGMSSRRRHPELGEPSRKRLCSATEDAVRRDDAPILARPSRTHGSLRPAGRTWPRPPAVNLEVPVAEPQGVSVRQVNDDERLARRLQHAFVSQASVTGNDEHLARSLQHEENRRLFRAPPAPPAPPAAAAPAFERWQLMYMRQLERARGSLHARSLQARTHHASSSREVLRQRSRVMGDVRRIRGSALEIEERLSVLGALLQGGQVPLAMQLSYVDRDFNENDYEMLLALDENVKQVGAAQSRIDELPVMEAEACESHEPCSICLEKPETGEHIRRLPCMHSFHQKCIDSWLQRRANCPVCKAEI